MNLKNLFRKKETQLSASEIIKRFGKDFSFNQIINLLFLFPEGEQRKIIAGVYKKQQVFWNSPDVVRYYAEFYPRSPFVPEHFDQLVASILPENNELIVDLGCGCGLLIKELFERNKDKNFKIIGIDYSVKALEKASELNSNYLENGRLELINHNLRMGIPLSDKSADKAVSNWGIVYQVQDDVEKIFSEVHRILKPKREFICVAVIKGNILSLFQPTIIKNLGLDLLKKLGEIKEGLKIQKRLHFLFPMYSLEELFEILENNGFKILKKQPALVGASMIFVTQKI